MIRLLIVDGDPVARDGLRGVFASAADMWVIGVTGDADQAVALASRAVPDVVLLDLQLPPDGAVPPIRQLAQSCPTARILVLTTHDTDPDLLAAIESGAIGFRMKGAPRAALIDAVRAVGDNAGMLAPIEVMPMADRVRGQRRLTGDGLSRRELEVLALIARGASNREAAAMLFISEATVGRHLEHAYQKLGVTDRAAAVTEALRRVLQQLDG